MSIELKGKWYKVDYSEKRVVPEGADLQKEREALWDDAHAQVDKQVADIFTIVGR